MAIWKQTCDLRRFDDTYKLSSPRLQQKWVCLDNGKEEWRDIPLVWNKRLSAAGPEEFE